MKRIQSIIILTFVLFSFIANAQTEQKEVFIIGTMHQVSKYLKNSYKPLYKMASAYQPDAIYVERSRAEDTLSMQNEYSQFLEYSDSIKTVFEFDETKFDSLMNADLKTMGKEDFRYLATSYVIKRDYANYRYYYSLLKHGQEGPRKSTRNENGEITHKLAIELGMKYIFSMDDQKDRRNYYIAWKTCAAAGKENGDDKEIKKIRRKLILSGIFPHLFKRNGKWTNSMKVMTRFHEINSFRYVKSDCESCKDGMKYWDARNRSMAINIGEQVNENDNQRNLVVVGAGHVIGLKEELEALYPNIIVKIVKDKPYKNTQPSQVEAPLISKR